MELSCKMVSKFVKEDDTMKYLPPEMREEYNRLTKENPDIPELNHPLINVSDAFRAYFILADFFTDESSGEQVEKMLVGLRDINLLESALCRQNVTFAGRVKYDNPIDICATLFFGLVKDHAFVDGNKRTALLLLLYQLTLYGYLPSAPVHEHEKLVVAVAANNLAEDLDFRGIFKKFKKKPDPEIQTISYWLRHKNTKKKDHSYHVSPTAKEFCVALEGLGVKCEIGSGKLHFTREIKGFLGTKNVKKYTVPFGGYTRAIGAKTARDILSGLDLYDEFASYQDLLNGSEPLYEIVDRFRVPLRRLKDL